MELPWLIVGLWGRHSNGLSWLSRIVRARSADVTCTSATTALIISGRCRDRRQSSTVWCAVQTPRARVGGAPSAPKPHDPSACRAGVGAGRCCAGSVIAALPAIGQCLSCVWSETTRTTSGGPTMPSRATWACTKRCWQLGNKTRSGWLKPTGISRRWC